MSRVNNFLFISSMFYNIYGFMSTIKIYFYELGKFISSRMFNKNISLSSLLRVVPAQCL